MRVACLMMQKDEDENLFYWLSYHGRLFGFENLFVFDNGSQSATTLKTLEAFERRGVTVDRTHPSPDHFKRKGEIIGAAIRLLDDTGRYDVLIPLDCDEFLIKRTTWGFTTDPVTIIAYIASLRGESRLLRIPFQIANNPFSQDFYIYFSFQKVFFASGTYAALDQGFHNGATQAGGVRDVELVHIHLHHPPHGQLLARSRRKWAATVPSITPEEALDDAAYTGDSIHLIPYFTMTEEDYRAKLFDNVQFFVPAFLRRLHDLAALTHVGLEINRDCPGQRNDLTNLIEVENHDGRDDSELTITPLLIPTFAFGGPHITWIKRYLDEDIYLRFHPDVAKEKLSALLHFCRFGYKEANRLQSMPRDVSEWQRERYDSASSRLLGRPRLRSVVEGTEGALCPSETKLFFTVAGRFNSTWSLAAVNRRFALQLDDLYPQACHIDADDGPITDAGGEETARLAEIAARRPPRGGHHVIIHQRWPVVAAPPHGHTRLAYFFWEESRIPAEVIEQLNTYDRILVPADLVREALLESGLKCPVSIIGFSPDLEPFIALARLRRMTLAREQPFTFLHVSTCFPHKGLDVLLRAYAKTFQAKDPVRLIIRGPREHALPQMKAIFAEYPTLAKIFLIDQPLDRPKLLHLYLAADAMVLPTRGEGFNMPAAESIAAGLPLIVTGYGAHMGFCDRRVARLINYNLVPSRSQFSVSSSLWAEPDIDDLCMAMQEAIAGKIVIDEEARHKVLDTLNDQQWTRHLTEILMGRAI